MPARICYDKEQAAQRLDAKALRVYGCLYGDVRRLNAGFGLDVRGSRTVAYREQKKAADKRGILWRMTFPEWVGVWDESGHWESRGRGRGKFCMARHGDAGAYEVGNVSIVRNEVKASDAHTGRKHGALKGYSLMGRSKATPYTERFRGKCIGNFATPDEAQAAYFAARTQYFAQRSGLRLGAHFLQGGNGCICDVNPWVRRVHAAHLVRVGLRRLNYIAHWLAYAVAHKT